MGGRHQSKKSGISGFSPREVASLMKEAKELRRIDDDRVIDKLVEAASQTDDSIVNEGTEQAMHHVAGYLAHTTMNTHKCQPCQDLLVNREAYQGSFVNNSEENRKGKQIQNQHFPSRIILTVEIYYFHLKWHCVPPMIFAMLTEVSQRIMKQNTLCSVVQTQEKLFPR